MFISPDENDKRYRIMQAAVKIFAQKGFYRAKMEEIAQEADVGKGTVYEYFPSKQQLFIEMFQTGKEYYFDFLTKQVKNQLGLYQQLKNIAYFHLRFFVEHKDIARVMLQEYLQLGWEMHQAVFQAQEEEIQVLENLFQEGVRNKSLRSIDTHTTAYAFYGAVNALGVPLLFQDAQDGRPDLEKISIEIVDLFYRGIEKAPQG